MTGFEVCDLVVALQLLAMHGCRANLDPPGATMSIIAGITAGQVGAPEVRNWLLPRLYRESEAGKWEAQMRNLLPAGRRPRRADKSGGELFGADPGGLREQVGRLAAAARRDGTQPGGDQQSA